MIIIKSIIVIILARRCCAELILSSIDEVRCILNGEKVAIRSINEWIQRETRRLTELQRQINQYRDANDVILKSDDEPINNPFQAFILVRRLRKTWQKIEKRLQAEHQKVFQGRIIAARLDMVPLYFPTDDDVLGASESLMRLAETYELDLVQSSSGNIRGVKFNLTFTSGNCYDIGKVAYDQNDYYHAIIWFEAAFKLAAMEGIQPLVNLANLTEFYTSALYRKGNPERALHTCHQMLRIGKHQYCEQTIGLIKQWAEKTNRTLKPIASPNDLPPLNNPRPEEIHFNRERYEALCRGDYGQPNSSDPLHFCYYKRDRPFLRYAPIKVEILNASPMALLFRGVISASEIDEIKRLSRKAMKKAQVVNRQQNGTYTNVVERQTRVAKNCWLGKRYAVIRDLDRRTQMMTNLDLETAEMVQVGNYGFGGHYKPHYDMSITTHKDKPGGHANIASGDGRNRIATVLFYLSQTILGGATVFPDVGLALLPSVGDALFWFNLNADGTNDMRTLHAGCPVLAGQKWVANKWIHEGGNEFTRKCRLASGKEANERNIGFDP